MAAPPGLGVGLSGDAVTLDGVLHDLQRTLCCQSRVGEDRREKAEDQRERDGRLVFFRRVRVTVPNR